MRRIHPALIGLLLLAGCGSAAPPGGDELRDPTVPETWVTPQWSPSMWFVWAEVRDFVGEERWAALDTSWMEEEARADMDEWGPTNQNFHEYMYAGLWRLGYLREEVLAAIAGHDGAAVWPLDPPGDRLRVAWRPRVERWLSAQPEGTRDDDLRAKLADSWGAAVAAVDTRVAARLVQVREERLGEGRAEALAADARSVVRTALAGMERGLLPEGVLFLLERFGVPEGVDLGPVLAAVRRRYREHADAVMPLPHPYDLHLACLRLERLLDRTPRPE